ncbi:MAG: MobA/MobL family protein [Clostridiales bacterium]|nr:MobA/MobL family protein [Clostridiales bacterium]
MGNGKIWLTPSEAAAGGLENQDRVSRSPRSTPHGRENPTAAYWNDPRRVAEWRKAWEDVVNQKFQTLGMEERIDACSYADQGKHQQPGVHMGHSAHNAEKRAKRQQELGAGFSPEEYRRYAQAVDKEHGAEKAAQKAKSRGLSR